MKAEQRESQLWTSGTSQKHTGGRVLCLPCDAAPFVRSPPPTPSNVKSDWFRDKLSIHAGAVRSEMDATCLPYWVQTWIHRRFYPWTFCIFQCSAFAYGSTFTPDSAAACCDVSHSSCADIHDNDTTSYQQHSCGQIGGITKCGIKSNSTTAAGPPGRFS